MKKWIELLQRLEVVSEDTIEVRSSEEVILICVELEIILPRDYLEFCQIFGTCILGGWIRIVCLSKEWNAFNQQQLLQGKSLEYEILSNPIYNSLFNNCYIFGSNTGGSDLLFDLQTYSELDKSCDIYLTDSISYIKKIGRDFYEFVTEFCLSTKAGEDCWEEPPQPTVEQYKSLSLIDLEGDYDNDNLGYIASAIANRTKSRW